MALYSKAIVSLTALCLCLWAAQSGTALYSKAIVDEAAEALCLYSNVIVSEAVLCLCLWPWAAASGTALNSKAIVDKAAEAQRLCTRGLPYQGDSLQALLEPCCLGQCPQGRQLHK